MAKLRNTRSGKRHTLAGILVSLALMATAADLSFLTHPLRDLAVRSSEGTLGLVPRLGMSILNVTHALAFHQVDYTSLFARILVLFCAMIAFIAGVVLLQPKSPRVQIIELVLSPERESREITNGSR